MLKIGLTGGIGSGKSTACALFAALGAPIIDADVIARQLVEPGQPALAELVTEFGANIVNDDGRLNRAALRDRVFAEPAQKQRLDAIMHPRIYAQIAAEVTCLDSRYCIIAIPLLVESARHYAVDRVLVIDCAETEQLQRVLARDQVSESQARAIIASQASRQQRLAQADDVIDNSAPSAQLAEQVKSLHNSYLLLANVRTPSA